jgi:hypothetical protein
MYHGLHNQVAQYRIEDMHRSAAASALRAEARHGTVTTHHARRLRAHSHAQPSMMRRLVARIAV